ncbi:MAG: CotH kinase family protein [Saprospiraceae bacterium]
MLPKTTFILLFITFAVSASGISQNNLIEKGDEWNYYDKGLAPSTQSDLLWYDLNYDDGNWKTGRAQLGYGDNDETTVINPGIRSLYVRKTMSIENPEQYELLLIDLLFDDGAIVYLNGVEVARRNMPSGNVTYESYASTVGVENGISRIRFKRPLLKGENVVAVEIHQESDMSSDLSFDLGMEPFVSDLGFISSSLPLIFINTDNSADIIDEPKVGATMRIIYNEDGSENNVNSTNYHYNGRIGIELRGQSSLDLFPKKGFGIETWDDMNNDDNVELLGFPKESDWVMHSPYSDKTLIRNVLAYHYGGQLMKYAPRVKLCELIINDEYYGVVVFTEKIKRDKNRVNISKLEPDENTDDDLTGGYILKWDKGEDNELAWVSPYRPIPHISNETRYLYHYPKAKKISGSQKTYIKNWITNVEDVLKSNNYAHPIEGYRKYLDVNSFVDIIIINEISRNIDGYRLSTFMHKDKDSKGGKLSMGPIWDYNLAFGNANYCDGGKTTGWAHQFNKVCPDDYWVNAFWWDRLLSDDGFKQQLKDRYFFLRQDILSTENVMHTVDSLTQHMGPAVTRNFDRWQILNRYIWPNTYVGRNYNNEIIELKRWLTARLEWLDQNISELTTDIMEITSDGPINVYPNPAHDVLYFVPKGADLFKRIRVYSMDGRMAMDVVYNSVVSLKGLDKTGVFIVHVVHEDGSVYMHKVMVE